MHTVPSCGVNCMQVTACKRTSQHRKTHSLVHSPVILGSVLIILSYGAHIQFLGLDTVYHINKAQDKMEKEELYNQY